MVSTWEKRTLSNVHESSGTNPQLRDQEDSQDPEFASLITGGSSRLPAGEEAEEEAEDDAGEEAGA